MRATLIFGALALALAAGCTSAVDVDELPSIDGYQSWSSIVVDGAAPGHGDTIREIFFNDVAARYPGAGQYGVGTVLVKEIYANNGGMRGDFDYIAVMRKLGEDAEDPPGGEVQGGWLFTFTHEQDGQDEVYFAGCWDNCHVQGPQDGAWFRYGE